MEYYKLTTNVSYTNLWGFFQIFINVAYVKDTNTLALVYSPSGIRSVKDKVIYYEIIKSIGPVNFQRTTKRLYPFLLQK